MKHASLTLLAVIALTSHCLADIYNVKAHGAIADDGLDDTAAFVDAFNKAELNGGRHTIYAPRGVYHISGSLSLSGYSSVLTGDGASLNPPAGTTLKAINQTGPVLNLDGWKSPGFCGRVKFSGFAVMGDSTPDTTQTKSGIRMGKSGSIAGTAFEDIAIAHTGGPCLDIGRAYMCDFNRITLLTPINAKGNDVPHFISQAANCNRFIGIGLFLGVHSNKSVAPSGAVVVEGDTEYQSHNNLFQGWWFEGLTASSNATFFHMAANNNVISDFQFIDCGKEEGATNTSYYKFSTASIHPPMVDGNFGANVLRGYLHGRGNSTTSLDYGIILGQSGNVIEGSKGFRGYNVMLAPGVQWTTVTVAGSKSNADWPAFVDNSGNATNTLVDYKNRLPANPDTGGASVQQLEAELNEVKAALRAVGVYAN